MKIKLLTIFLLIFLIVPCVLFGGCKGEDGSSDLDEDEPIYMNLNTEYTLNDSLPDGEGKKTKVILLLGQSNATGASINEYLKNNLGEQRYQKYEEGFPDILINYCLDDHNATSKGEYLKVDMTCGATNGFFGPEVGIAEALSEEYPDEKIIILKYTMSGYSLHRHWLRQGQRGSIYDAFLIFVNTYMEQLKEKNYDAAIGAVCWMQGESDTTEYKASKYYENQVAFVSYLRQDLEKYAEDGKIYFIDAGISNGPYCEPGYPQVNEAKENFSKLSEYNLYFSTIDLGLTVHLEPPSEPDWGHYDSLSELKLGQTFGELIIQSYNNRNLK